MRRVAEAVRRKKNKKNTPNLPTNITPTNIARLKLSGKFPMGLGIPPLYIKIMLESSPPKSTMLVGRLGVTAQAHTDPAGLQRRGRVRASTCIYIYIYMYIERERDIMYICMCVYIYIYMYTHIHAYIYIYTHMYMYMYKDTLVVVCSYLFAYYICLDAPVRPISVLRFWISEGLAHAES